jgi:DNA-binding transcriptional ArsR family regulator
MLELVLAAIATVTAVVALLKARSGGTVDKSSEDTLLAITEDYSKRVSRLEGRIVDLQVRLDILETQVVRSNSVVKASEPKVEKVGFVTSHKDSDITKSEICLGDFELAILKCIKEGVKTPLEVRKVVGRSREHVARALKQLYELGLVDRKGGRPFVYSLSDKGLSALDRVASGV